MDLGIPWENGNRTGFPRVRSRSSPAILERDQTRGFETRRHLLTQTDDLPVSATIRRLRSVDLTWLVPDWDGGRRMIRSEQRSSQLRRYRQPGLKRELRFANGLSGLPALSHEPRPSAISGHQRHVRTGTRFATRYAHRRAPATKSSVRSTSTSLLRTT